MFDIGVLDQFAHSLPTATIQGTVLVTYLDGFICATVVGSNRWHGLEVGGAFTVDWKSMVAFRQADNSPKSHEPISSRGLGTASSLLRITDCLSPSDVPSSAKPLRVSFRSLSPFGLAPSIYYGTSR